MIFDNEVNACLQRNETPLKANCQADYGFYVYGESSSSIQKAIVDIMSIVKKISLFELSALVHCSISPNEIQLIDQLTLLDQNQTVAHTSYFDEIYSHMIEFLKFERRPVSLSDIAKRFELQLEVVLQKLVIGKAEQLTHESILYDPNSSTLLYHSHEYIEAVRKSVENVLKLTVDRPISIMSFMDIHKNSLHSITKPGLAKDFFNNDGNSYVPPEFLDWQKKTVLTMWHQDKYLDIDNKNLVHGTHLHIKVEDVISEFEKISHYAVEKSLIEQLESSLEEIYHVKSTGNLSLYLPQWWDRKFVVTVIEHVFKKKNIKSLKLVKDVFAVSTEWIKGVKERVKETIEAIIAEQLEKIFARENPEYPSPKPITFQLIKSSFSDNSDAGFNEYIFRTELEEEFTKKYYFERFRQLYDERYNRLWKSEESNLIIAAAELKLNALGLANLLNHLKDSPDLQSSFQFFKEKLEQGITDAMINDIGLDRIMTILNDAKGRIDSSVLSSLQKQLDNKNLESFVNEIETKFFASAPPKDAYEREIIQLGSKVKSKLLEIIEAERRLNDREDLALFLHSVILNLIQRRWSNVNLLVPGRLVPFLVNFYGSLPEVPEVEVERLKMLLKAVKKPGSIELEQLKEAIKSLKT